MVFLSLQSVPVQTVARVESI